MCQGLSAQGVPRVAVITLLSTYCAPGVMPTLPHKSLTTNLKDVILIFPMKELKFSQPP